MIKKIFIFIFLWIIVPATSFAQDSIPISPDLKEENLLKFQDHFFKALAQKSIYNYRVAIQNLEKCNQLKPNDVSVLFELFSFSLFLRQLLVFSTSFVRVSSVLLLYEKGRDGTTTRGNKWRAEPSTSTYYVTRMTS